MPPSGVRTSEATARISAQVGRLITPASLANALRNGKLKPPMKDSGGVYWWTEDDILAAVQAFLIDRRRSEYRTPQLLIPEVQCAAG